MPALDTEPHAPLPPDGIGYLLLEAQDRLNASAGRMVTSAGSELVLSVIRATPAHLGLRFERIERDDRLLPAALALAYHRRG